MGNFVVSARKYRPATFEMVVGQRHITSTLKNAIERGLLAHAYLFCGPRGVGKTTCARIFAKTINCLSPRVGGEACGVCESCVGFADGRSMNIHELDAASNNKVEDIRSLIEQVRIIPQVGRYALFIIDEVHMLSTAAFNAFLKTLEEPPAHAIFILATTERHKILPTILSRCQCYDFNRIRVEDGAEYLRYIANTEGVTVDDESLNLIAQKADGGMRDALSMFDKAVSFGGNTLDFKIVSQTLGVVDYDTYFVLTDALLEANYHEALIIFDRVLGSGFGASSFLGGFAKHLRDLLVAQDDTTAGLMELTAPLMARYRDQASRCSVELLFGAISILTEADGALRRSSNQRLLVELGLMKIAGLGKKKIDSSAVESQAANFTQVKPTLQAVELRAYEGAAASVASAPKADVLKVEAPKAEAPKVEALKAEIEVLKVEDEIEVLKVEDEAPKVEAPKVDALKAEDEAPKADVPKIIKPKPLFDLQEELRGAMKSAESEAVESVAAIRIDPYAEAKLLEARDEIIAFIATARPRFKPQFEGMAVAGSTISIEVPTKELEFEIRRNETELMGQIVEIADVMGYVELKVVVNERIRVKRPIKLEDRVAHFAKLNPQIVALTEALDLQVDS